MKNNLQSLLTNLHLQPKNTSLIRQAFVHRSYLNESSRFSTSNERLEYLGDAVLELAVSEFLYTNYRQYQEGMLTNLRAALVKTSTLAQLAQEIGLSNYILMSKGEQATGGRSNPSILADTFEAFLGAIYLSEGFPAVQKILHHYLFPKTDVIINNSQYKDSKSLLQEIAQTKLKTTPEYQLISETGPDHAKTFVVQVIIGKTTYATGQGKSKQAAQEEAAQRTLEMLKNN